MPESSQRLVSAGPRDFTPRHIPLGALPQPASGEVHAWFLDLQRLGQPLRNALGGSSANEAGGAPDPSPFTAGQLRFARRFYLRLLLGAYLGIPGKSVYINRRQRGKPVLDAARHSELLHFSMAKSGACLLIGFSSEVYLGVDLEPAGRRARNALGVAQRYFSASEAAALSGLAPKETDVAFVRTWACKEAVVKASGQGIANQFCRFSVETDPARPAAVLDFEGENADDWSLALVRPDEDYLGAVAARAKRMRIRAFRLLPSPP
jgi:4'-phosphopantetheinyl transferase